MGMIQKLKELNKEQKKVADGYRLFHDGSLKIKTLTDSGDVGWCVIAKLIPAASPSIRSYFTQHDDGIYLRTQGLREALEVRDLILIQMTESRVTRQNETGLWEFFPSESEDADIF